MVRVGFDSKFNVVQAAEQRIINVFSNKKKVYLAFSGGKDSLALATVVLNLASQGKINMKQLEVVFIDEEAIFPSIEQTTLAYRKKFILMGAKFTWYALPVKHYNCFNSLTCDESFICFDPVKKDTWVRKPPSFAVTFHPLLKPYKETYQDFLGRILQDGIKITGIRAAESIQRRSYLYKSLQRSTSSNNVWPIFDWSDNDVWLYLKENHVPIPDVYLKLYQVGTPKNQLRCSQFFSNDTAKVLVRLGEYYPDLMAGVVRREPNAYLASLYWDSEMFGRSTRGRRALEKKDDTKDYKKLLLDVLKDIPGNFPTEHGRMVARRYMTDIVRHGAYISKKQWKKLYEGLMAGDPKTRTLRACMVAALCENNDNRVKKE